MIQVAIAIALAGAAMDRAADIAALREAKLVAWPNYYRINDADGLARFLADGFVKLDADGKIETRAEAVAWLRANKWRNADNGFRYDIRDIVFYNADAANVFGQGSFKGETCRMAYTSSNIFVRDAGRWRPKFSHTSKPACLPGTSG